MQPNVQQTRRAPLSLGPVEFATFGLNTWESGQQKGHDLRIEFASLPSSAKSFVLEKLYAPSKYKGPICQTRNIKQENFTLDTSNEPKRPLPHIETHPEPNLYLIPIAAHRAVESLPSHFQGQHCFSAQTLNVPYPKPLQSSIRISTLLKEPRFKAKPMKGTPMIVKNEHVSKTHRAPGNQLLLPQISRPQSATKAIPIPFWANVDWI